jgi:hypothetical protein
MLIVGTNEETSGGCKEGNRPALKMLAPISKASVGRREVHFHSGSHIATLRGLKKDSEQIKDQIPAQACISIIISKLST